MSLRRQLKINLPDDVKDWLSSSAKSNLRSQTAEIEFVLREKMAEHADKKADVQRA